MTPTQKHKTFNDDLINLYVTEATLFESAQLQWGLL